MLGNGDINDERSKAPMHKKRTVMAPPYTTVVSMVCGNGHSCHSFTLHRSGHPPVSCPNFLPKCSDDRYTLKTREYTSMAPAAAQRDHTCKVAAM